MDVEIPLDQDGFLPQECPTCHRPFRIEVLDEEASSLHCPYCGVKSDAGDFLTPAQVEYLVDAAADVAFREFEESGFRVERSGPRPPVPVPAGEAVRVDFACHPGPAVKVLPSWLDARQPLQCTACGSTR